MTECATVISNCIVKVYNDDFLLRLDLLAINCKAVKKVAESDVGGCLFVGEFSRNGSLEFTQSRKMHHWSAPVSNIDPQFQAVVEGAQISLRVVRVVSDHVLDDLASLVSDGVNESGAELPTLCFVAQKCTGGNRTI